MRPLIGRGIDVLCRCARLRVLVLAVLVPVLTLAGTAGAAAATLRVNTTKDELNPPDHKCSLRGAIDAANSPGTKTACGTAGDSLNVIVLGAKKYHLSIPPGSGDSDQNCIDPSGMTVPDQNATGDLCITSQFPLTITGRGPTTTIDGLPSLKDRLMTIAPQASVSLVALNLEGGQAPDGAAGAVSCSNPLVMNNGANGGAIYNTGTLYTTIVTAEGNSAGVGGAGDDTTGANGCNGGNGGGIYNDGTLTVQNSMFVGNAAGAGGAGGGPGGSLAGGTGGTGGSGGGIYNDSGTLMVSNSTFASNEAGAGGAGGVPSGSGNGGGGGDGSPGGGISSAGGSLSVTNATLTGNQAGPGGLGGNSTGGTGGNGGAGANGGAVAVDDSSSGIRNATVASNILGAGGEAGTGSPAGSAGSNGTAGGIFVQSSGVADDLRLQNSIAASNAGMNCLGSPGSAIANGGHNLSFGDTTCPAVTTGNPELEALANYGGYTETLALRQGSAAINKVPRNGAGCPATDERTVRRPQGSACDIGAFEFARPRIEIDAPRNGARYKRGSRVVSFFVCSEGGITSPLTTPIASCAGTVANGRRINTSTLGRKSFRVTARDREGNRTSKTVHYTVIR